MINYLFCYSSLAMLKDRPGASGKPEGPGFELRSPRIAQARVRLATDTLPQTPHRAGALCTGYALLVLFLGSINVVLLLAHDPSCQLSNSKNLKFKVCRIEHLCLKFW